MLVIVFGLTLSLAMMLLAVVRLRRWVLRVIMKIYWSELLLQEAARLDLA
jgi:hypothetical protein